MINEELTIELSLSKARSMMIGFTFGNLVGEKLVR
jgi:hypothetical protein